MSIPSARLLFNSSLQRQLSCRLFLPSIVTTNQSRTMSSEFKVKGISSLKLKDGEMSQVEIEGIEGGKALLINHAGSISAMSANCTHYGAPLKDGILSPDGRLTCPWHGGKHKIRL